MFSRTQLIPAQVQAHLPSSEHVGFMVSPWHLLFLQPAQSFLVSPRTEVLQTRQFLHYHLFVVLFCRLHLLKFFQNTHLLIFVFLFCADVSMLYC